MSKMPMWFAVVGFGAALILVFYAFFSTANPSAPQLDPLVYIILCPPSLGLMATEHLHTLGRIVVSVFIVLANSCVYGAVGLGLELLKKKPL